MQAAIAKNHDLYRGDQNYVRARTANYPINEESRPITEYYLGLVVKKMLFGLESVMMRRTPIAARDRLAKLSWPNWSPLLEENNLTRPLYLLPG